MNFWWVMILAGAITFATRLSFIWLLGNRNVPDWMRRGLRYVPPAVLTAIVFPEVLLVGAEISLLPWHNPRLVAALVAGVVAWRTRNALWTIVVGMLVLWLVQQWE